MPTKSVAELRAAVAQALPPLSGDAADYRIVSEVGSTFLARPRTGSVALLVPLDVVPATAGRRGGGFSLSPIGRVAFEHEGRRWEQGAAILECTDQQMVDAFYVLIADVAERLSRGPIVWQAVLGCVDEWQALLAHRPLLTIEQQLGLWGELWLISTSLDPDLMAAGWRGPEGQSTDFFVDGTALEVKVSRTPHVHHVSLSQIDAPVGLHEAYLLSIWVGVDPQRGRSLSELVDSTLARVSDPPSLLKQIARTGYAPIDRERYESKFIPLEAPLLFRVADVPRVREVDAGVSLVRYVVTMDRDRALVDDAADHIWKRFRAHSPRIEMGGTQQE